MSLRQAAVDEFKRGPITVTATIVGVAIAAIGLIVAWLQNPGPATSAATGVTQSTTGGLRLSSFFLATSFFVASSLSSASLIHILDRRHPFHAAVLSVPAAVVTGFLSLLVLQLSPPRPITEQSFEQAQDMVFWGTLFIFLAMNGRSMLKVFLDPEPAPQSSSEDAKPTDAKRPDGAFLILFLLLGVWGKLVSVGISKMTQLFLL